MADVAKRGNSIDRRQATVVFADISGFTAIAEQMDPEDLHGLMDACFEIMEEVLTSHGGTVDKFVGDCVMGVFGAPRAMEDTPKHAVNAAIEIRKALSRFNDEYNPPHPLGIHIGINSGLVVAGDIGGKVKRDYTVMGPTVNLAARLQGAAKEGEIFVGEATQQCTSEEFQYRKLRPLSLKGVGERVHAYKLMSGVEHPHRRAPGAGSGLSSELVGRDSEVALIKSKIARLGQGTGGVVSIEGETGIGKSRLFKEATGADALGGAVLLKGRSLSLGQSRSFHPVVDMLLEQSRVEEGATPEQMRRALEAFVSRAAPQAAEEILPFLAQLIGAEPGAMRSETAAIQGDALEKLIHKSVRTLLEQASQIQPVILVLEDLHWIDQSSAALLEFLLPLAQTHPILFIHVFRPRYEDTSGRILTYVESNLAEQHCHLRLDHLGDRACDTLIENLMKTDELPASIRGLIKEKSEGNPFYIEEVVRSLIDQGALVRKGDHLVASSGLPGIEIPGSIHDVTMARVDLLEAQARRVLQVGSVLGRSFSRKILAEVVPEGIDIDAELETLVDKGLLVRVATRGTASVRRRLLIPETEYSFQHALIQDAVYASLLKRARQELHLKCAEAIEHLFSERREDFLGMLAYHFVNANAPQKAEEYLFAAGEHAARSAASAEALHYFREANRFYLSSRGEAADERKKALLEKNIALALLNTGELAECIGHFNAALDLYGEKVPKSALGLNLKLAADLPAIFLHLYGGVRGRLRKRSKEDDRALFEILYNRARAQNPTDPKRSFFDNLTAIRQLTNMNPAKTDHACGMYASAGLFFCFSGLSFAVGRKLLATAQPLASDGGVGDKFQYRTMAFVLHYLQGDWTESHDIDEGLLDYGLRVGMLWNADIYLGLNCERNMRQGKYELARKQIEKLGTLSPEFGYEFAESNVYANNAYLLVEKRELPEALTAVQAYHDSRHEDTLRLIALGMRAKVEVLQGKIEEAGATLERAERIIRRSGQIPPYYLGAYTTSRLLVDLERLQAECVGAGRPRAGRLVRKSLNHCRHALKTASSVARERTETFRLAGDLYCLLGKEGEARRFWEKALAEGERLGARPEVARTCMDIGYWLALRSPSGATFNDKNAAAWLTEARSVFAELGLRWDLERLDTARERAVA